MPTDRDTTEIIYHAALRVFNNDTAFLWAKKITICHGRADTATTAANTAAMTMSMHPNIYASMYDLTSFVIGQLEVTDAARMSLHGSCWLCIALCTHSGVCGYCTGLEYSKAYNLPHEFRSNNRCISFLQSLVKYILQSVQHLHLSDSGETNHHYAENVCSNVWYVTLKTASASTNILGG